MKSKGFWWGVKRFVLGRDDWFGDGQVLMSELTSEENRDFVREVVRDRHWNKNETAACKRYGVVVDIDYANDRFITSLLMHGD